MSFSECPVNGLHLQKRNGHCDVKMNGSTSKCDKYSNAYDFICDKVKVFGKQISQIDSETGKQINYVTILERSCILQRVLTSLGIGPGTVTMFLSKNSINYSWVLLGTMASGTSSYLMNPSYSIRELQHSLSLCRPKLVLSCGMSEEQLMVFQKFESVEHIIIVDHDDDENVPSFCLSLKELMIEFNVENNIDVEDMFTKVPVKSDDVALILTSSGSTGLPKGVQLTHSNIINALKLDISKKIAGKDEIALGLMPFSHAFGLILMLMCLCEGTKVVTMSKFNLQKFSNNITKYKITNLYLVTSLFITMTKDESVTKEKMESVHKVWTGATKMNDTVQKEFKTKFPYVRKLYHSYGLTETTFINICGEFREDKPSSIGSLVSPFKIKIIDQESGKVVEKCKQGEICLRGPLLMKGYLNNETATKECIDEEGWLHTGDIGYCDEDGYFFILDRIKEIIKFQGLQIAPSEVEAVLLTNEKIKEAAVVGIPDNLFGEVPRAYIVKQPNQEISEDEIHSLIKNELSPYKQLRGGIRFIAEIPKTLTGKPKRRSLLQV